MSHQHGCSQPTRVLNIGHNITIVIVYDDDDDNDDDDNDKDDDNNNDSNNDDDDDNNNNKIIMVIMIMKMIGSVDCTNIGANNKIKTKAHSDIINK